MESRFFDQLSKVVASDRSRRSALQALAAAVFGIAVPLGAGHLADAKRKKRHHKKKKKGLPLQATCTPGESRCKKGLKCDSPTTRHTCDSAVDGVDTWCCVPPGGKCTECDCCGDYYCDFGDANPEGACIPNPEG